MGIWLRCTLLTLYNKTVFILSMFCNYLCFDSANVSEQAPGTGFSDRLITDLADDIETEEEAEALGQALGFSHAAINRYLATNILNGRMTTKGTRDMLFAWRQRTFPENHHDAMKKALLESKLVLLAHKHLGASFVPDGNRFSRPFSSLHSILENVFSISSRTHRNVRMLVSISSSVDKFWNIVVQIRVLSPVFINCNSNSSVAVTEHETASAISSLGIHFRQKLNKNRLPDVKAQ